MSATLVDSNVILDIFNNDFKWFSWSSDRLDECAEEGKLCINPVIYGEVSFRFSRIEDLEASLPPSRFERLAIPYEAAFLAGKAFLQYKKLGGAKTSPLPDFLIGAHAAVSGLRLLTRDAARFATYFPSVELIAPP